MNHTWKSAPFLGRLTAGLSDEIHLIDLTELRPGSPEHERRAEGHLEGPVHQVPSENPIGGVTVLRHADQSRRQGLPPPAQTHAGQHSHSGIGVVSSPSCYPRRNLPYTPDLIPDACASDRTLVHGETALPSHCLYRDVRWRGSDSARPQKHEKSLSVLLSVFSLEPKLMCDDI